VSLPAAGTLISAYAIGVVVGAPVLAALTLRLPRRTVLVTSQLVFVAATVVGMLVDGYWPLLIARVVTGLAYAGFWAAAMVTAVGLVDPDRTARALSVVVGGLSLAMVVGGPLGTVIGDLAGWRAGFWALAVATLLTAIVSLVVLPSPRADEEPVRELRTELRAIVRPRLLVVYATTLLSTGAYMVTYSYLAGLLIEVSGLSQSAVPGVLALFGVGAFLGLGVGGRTADRRPFTTLLAGLAGIVAVSVGIAAAAPSATWMVVLVFLLGFTAFVLNPSVYARVFAVGTDAPTLAGATTVSAFQLGITLAALAGGAAITGTGELVAVAWVGILAALAAAVTTAVDAARRPSITADLPS
jgi:DHA1 family chloramphenicol resistance protein-like MFS transporter